MKKRIRKRTQIAGIGVCIMIFCAWAHVGRAADEGQGKDMQKPLQGYAFFSPGAILGDGPVSTMNFGGGLDALIYRGLPLRLGWTQVEKNRRHGMGSRAVTPSPTE